MDKIKKFISIKTIADVEIKTDIGYVPVKNIMKTVKYAVYLVKFESGYSVKCADNHIFIGIDDTELYAKDLIQGSMVKSDIGDLKCLSVTNLGYVESMFDVQMEYHHKFYTNGILSHNTTFAAAYICHQTVFNSEYTTAVLANKAAGSREVLTRIKQMYEELPWFLQMGVKEWNKGRIELGNGSKVISAASSTSSIRGTSINCVSTDNFVTVRSKTTGEIEKITIEELEARLGNS